MKISLFLLILNMSLSASIVILIVLCLRHFLRNMSKTFSYVLWIVVLIRLVCPIAIEFPVSAIPEKVSNGTVVDNITNYHVGEYEIYWDNSEEYQTALQQEIKPTIVLEKENGSAGAYVVTSIGSIAEADTVLDCLMPILCFVWLVGIMILSAYHLISYVKLKKSWWVLFPTKKTISTYQTILKCLL